MESNQNSPKVPEDAFAAIASMRRLANRLERNTVKDAIAKGWTWAKIAEALEITKQAAHKRHAKHIKNIKK